MHLPPSFLSSHPVRQTGRALLTATLLLIPACGSGGSGGTGVGAGPGPGPAPAFARLWVPHFNRGEVQAWNQAKVANDVDQGADVVLTLPAGTKPNAVTFDATGALWVTDNAGARLLKFGRGQITTSGQPVPQVRIESDGLSLLNPIGLTFDSSNNLWVATSGRLEMYSPANLDESGPTTPDRILQSAEFDSPVQILFDSMGNLWVTNAGSTVYRNSVLVFTPGQLAGGQQEPLLILLCDSFNRVEGLGFDRAGNPWVANNDGSSISRFAAFDVRLPNLPERRRLVPRLSLESDTDDSPTGRTVRKPGGIVFDRDGNLFVNSERGLPGTNTSSVVKFTREQLANLGAPQMVRAAVVLSRSTSNPGFGGLALELP